MKWKKRDCPIRIEIDQCGDGWEDITLDICGDHHRWSVSGCIGDGFWALVESLYVLYPHHVYGDVERMRLLPSSNDISIPKKAKFFWDLEGWGVWWELTITFGQAKDYLLIVDLEENDYDRKEDDEDRKTFHYEVKFSDFCYAVGKAITEAVKKYGFGGFQASVWESDVNIRHLCFLKSCGMGMPDAVHPVDSIREYEGVVSSFNDEIELLLFDM